MTKTTLQCISFITFKALIVVLLFQFTTSAPVNSSISYDTFLKNITRDNCAFPNGIVLPFNNSTITFQYFSEFLKICKAPEAMKRPLEAVTLCSEIYNALRNITCQSDKNVQFPEINIELSDNVCKDISSLQIQNTLGEKGLLQHLTDKFVCEMMCEDDFLPACKVLLWSFQLQMRIKDIPLVQSIQNPEQKNANPVDEVALPSDTQTVLKLTSMDAALVKEQALQTNHDVPAVESPDDSHKLNNDHHVINDDTDKNKLEHPLKNSEDNQNVEVGNEIPGESKPEIRKDNELGGKQDQTLKSDNQNQLQPMGNIAFIEENEAGETKINEQNLVINNQPIVDNKIGFDERPSKFPESNSKNTVFPDKKVALIPKLAKGAGNKTEHKTDIKGVVPDDLLPKSQKENPVDITPIDIKNNNSSTTFKPVISELNNELNKLPASVSQSPTPSKILPDNEAKASKPEISQPKENKVSDTKVIPPISKENAIPATTVADLEKMEEGNGIPDPADKEPDLYIDVSNQQDEDGFYNSVKNKKQEDSDAGKISKPAVAENEPPKYDVFPQRNSFGRAPDDIQVIPAFPDQEDSHFFFYFLSLVLILMAGYLLFHNKQKIIALIVEGRHERRRRSHGAAYKKLDTK